MSSSSSSSSTLSLSPASIAGIAVGSLLAVYLVVKFLLFWRQYTKAAEKLEKANVPFVSNKFPTGGAWTFGEAKDNTPLEIAKKYGKDGMVFMQIVSKQFAVVTKHTHFKTILNKAPHHYPRGTGIQKGQDPTLYWMGDTSIMYTDVDKHDEWRFLRRLIGKPFLSTNVDKLREPMTRVHGRFCDYLESRCKVESAAKEPFPMQNFLFNLTFDVLGESAFSQDFGGLKALDGGQLHPVIENITRLCDLSNGRLPEQTLVKWWRKPKYAWIPTPSNNEFRGVRNKMQAEVMRLITDREKAIKEQGDEGRFVDFLQMLIDAQDSETGRCLSRRQLRSNLTAMLFAGFDTTGTSLTFTLYSIAKNPEVQKKLQEEIDRVLPYGTPVTQETYKNLEYARWVFKEALRLYSPLYLTIRCIQEDLPIGDIVAPGGTTFMFPVFEAMRDADNWDDPLEFRPERFAPDGEASKKFHAFMPFMHGQRNCIGIRFAEMSSVLTIASLAQRFEFEVPADYEMDVVRSVPMIKPKHALNLIVRNRHNGDAAAVQSE